MEGSSCCPPGPREQGEQQDSCVTGAGLRPPQPGTHPQGTPAGCPVQALHSWQCPTCLSSHSCSLRAWPSGLEELRWDGGSGVGQESTRQGRDEVGPGIPRAGPVAEKLPLVGPGVRLPPSCPGYCLPFHFGGWPGGGAFETGVSRSSKDSSTWSPGQAAPSLPQSNCEDVYKWA